MEPTQQPMLSRVRPARGREAALRELARAVRIVDGVLGKYAAHDVAVEIRGLALAYGLFVVHEPTVPPPQAAAEVHP